MTFSFITFFLISQVCNLENKIVTPGLKSRRSMEEARSILPIHLLNVAGIAHGKNYIFLEFQMDVSKFHAAEIHTHR